MSTTSGHISSTRAWFACMALATALFASLIPSAFAQPPPPAAGSSVRPPASAVVPGGPGPGTVQPDKSGNYDVEMWRRVRGGIEGQVSIPDKKAGQLVQSGGETWRNFRNGPLPAYGATAMGAMLALLALFYLLRGRIRIEHGFAGRTIERFSDLERTGHWLMAVSFIILGLTGLNVLYGKAVLLPVIGKDGFAWLSAFFKWTHNTVAFAFMLGLALSFVMWLRHNLPNRHDLVWLAKGGGMFSKGVHVPAKKFNAGQKILFWLIMLGGVSISLSGLALMFPFSGLFGKVFGWLGFTGLIPTAMTPMQEMQSATVMHGIMGIVMICVIFAHIYIGSIGMEGALAAMTTGQVDENWAKEHHSIWADEELVKGVYEPAANRPLHLPAE